MIVAQLTGAPQDRVDMLAVLFIVARLAHFGFYLADLSTLRSVAWFIAMASAVAIFVAGA